MRTVLEKIPSPDQLKNYILGLHLENNRLFLLIVAILVIAFFLDFFLSRSVFGKKYRIFVAPGVIVHEFSHVIACLINGAKIRKVSLFDKDGGMVEHEGGIIPFISPAIISMSPFFIGLLSIYFLSRKLGLASVNIFNFAGVGPEGFAGFMKSIVSGINIYDYQNWIIVYLVLSIAVTMVPSWQDLRNSFISLIVIAVAIFSIEHFGIFNFSQYILQSNQLIVLLSTVIFLLILSLALSIIVFALSIFFKK